MGISTFILQNMLNTPRSTWGVQDLAKSRALLSLIRELEDSSFRVILQPRAGLDYFKPDLEVAKVQLAAVTALMDDIEPHDETSPPINHVVSYSEASHLATPEVVNESIKITQYSLQKYRELKRKGEIPDLGRKLEVKERTGELIEAAKTLIAGMEAFISDLYTPEGLYKAFAAGFLQVPYLWGEMGEFQFAKAWTTKPIRGGVKIVDKDSSPVKPERIVDFARMNLPEAEYLLKQRMGKNFNQE